MQARLEKLDKSNYDNVVVVVALILLAVFFWVISIPGDAGNGRILEPDEIQLSGVVMSNHNEQERGHPQNGPWRALVWSTVRIESPDEFRNVVVRICWDDVAVPFSQFDCVGNRVAVKLKSAFFAERIQEDSGHWIWSRTLLDDVLLNN